MVLISLETTIALRLCGISVLNIICIMRRLWRSFLLSMFFLFVDHMGIPEVSITMLIRLPYWNMGIYPTNTRVSKFRIRLHPVILLSNGNGNRIVASVLIFLYSAIGWMVLSITITMSPVICWIPRKWLGRLAGGRWKPMSPAWGMPDGNFL